MVKSIGAVIYSQEKEEEPKFLLLHYPGTKRDYWGLVKGHVEKGEREIQTLRREALEETGIENLRVKTDFRKEIRYFFHLKERKIFKRVIFYLAQANKQKIQLSHEHIGYEWLNFSEAIKQLSFYGPRKVLKKAYKHLTKK